MKKFVEVENSIWYYCGVCSVSFQCPKRVETHHKVEHQHVCACGTKFDDKPSLLVHMEEVGCRFPFPFNLPSIEKYLVGNSSPERRNEINSVSGNGELYESSDATCESDVESDQSGYEEVGREVDECSNPSGNNSIESHGSCSDAEECSRVSSRSAVESDGSDDEQAELDNNSCRFQEHSDNVLPEFDGSIASLFLKTDSNVFRCCFCSCSVLSDFKNHIMSCHLKVFKTVRNEHRNIVCCEHCRQTKTSFVCLLCQKSYASIYKAYDHLCLTHQEVTSSLKVDLSNYLDQRIETSVTDDSVHDKRQEILKYLYNRCSDGKFYCSLCDNKSFVYCRQVIEHLQKFHEDIMQDWKLVGNRMSVGCVDSDDSSLHHGKSKSDIQVDSSEALDSQKLADDGISIDVDHKQNGSMPNFPAKNSQEFITGDTTGNLSTDCHSGVLMLYSYSSSKIYSCSVCNFGTNNKVSLFRHFRLCSPELYLVVMSNCLRSKSRFHCQLCRSSLSFRHHRSLRLHTFYEHGLEDLKNIPAKGIAFRQQVKKYLQGSCTELSDGRFKCNFCQKLFMSNKAVFGHLRKSSIHKWPDSFNAVPVSEELISLENRMKQTNPIVKQSETKSEFQGINNCTLTKQNVNNNKHPTLLMYCKRNTIEQKCLFRCRLCNTKPFLSWQAVYNHICIKHTHFDSKQSLKLQFDDENENSRLVSSTRVFPVDVCEMKEAENVELSDLEKKKNGTLVEFIRHFENDVCSLTAQNQNGVFCAEKEPDGSEHSSSFVPEIQNIFTLCNNFKSNDEIADRLDSVFDSHYEEYDSSSQTQATCKVPEVFTEKNELFENPSEIANDDLNMDGLRINSHPVLSDQGKMMPACIFDLEADISPNRPIPNTEASCFNTTEDGFESLKKPVHGLDFEADISVDQQMSNTEASSANATTDGIQCSEVSVHGLDLEAGISSNPQMSNTETSCTNSTEDSIECSKDSTHQIDFEVDISSDQHMPNAEASGANTTEDGFESSKDSTHQLDFDVDISPDQQMPNTEATCANLTEDDFESFKDSTHELSVEAYISPDQQMPNTEASCANALENCFESSKDSTCELSVESGISPNQQMPNTEASCANALEDGFESSKDSTCELSVESGISPDQQMPNTEASCANATEDGFGSSNDSTCELSVESDISPDQQMPNTEASCANALENCFESSKDSTCELSVESGISANQQMPNTEASCANALEDDFENSKDSTHELSVEADISPDQQMPNTEASCANALEDGFESSKDSTCELSVESGISPDQQIPNTEASCANALEDGFGSSKDSTCELSVESGISPDQQMPNTEASCANALEEGFESSKDSTCELSVESGISPDQQMPNTEASCANALEDGFGSSKDSTCELNVESGISPDQQMPNTEATCANATEDDFGSSEDSTCELSVESGISPDQQLPNTKASCANALQDGFRSSKDSTCELSVESGISPDQQMLITEAFCANALEDGFGSSKDSTCELSVESGISPDQQMPNIEASCANALQDGFRSSKDSTCELSVESDISPDQQMLITEASCSNALEDGFGSSKDSTCELSVESGISPDQQMPNTEASCANATDDGFESSKDASHQLDFKDDISPDQQMPNTETSCANATEDGVEALSNSLNSLHYNENQILHASWKKCVKFECSCKRMFSNRKIYCFHRLFARCWPHTRFSKSRVLFKNKIIASLCNRRDEGFSCRYCERSFPKVLQCCYHIMRLHNRQVTNDLPRDVETGNEKKDTIFYKIFNPTHQSLPPCDGSMPQIHSSCTEIDESLTDDMSQQTSSVKMSSESYENVGEVDSFVDMNASEIPSSSTRVNGQFKCRFCSQTFLKGCGLSSHLKSCTGSTTTNSVGQNLYCCSVCTTQYSFKSNLLRHLRSVKHKRQWNIAEGRKDYRDKKINKSSGSCMGTDGKSQLKSSKVHVKNASNAKKSVEHLECPRCRQLIPRSSFHKHKTACKLKHEKVRKTALLSEWKYLDSQCVRVKGKFVCQKCQAKYSIRSSVFRHVRRVHGVSKQTISDSAMKANQFGS